MTRQEPKAIRLADYRAPDYRIETVELEFDIEPRTTRVKARLALRATYDRSAGVRPLVLDGDALELVGLARDGKALGKGEFQWAAELADYVLAGQPLHADARQLKGRALTELGERQGNAGARNYYLSAAQRLLSPPPQREERRQ